MKILKLFLAFAILSLSITNLSLLKAADENTVTESTSVPNASTITTQTEETKRKGFFKSLLFWKNNKDLDNQNIDEISDEELDPRLKIERAKPKEIRIRDKYSVKIDVLKLFETNLKDTADLNKDTEFVFPLDEIEREIYIEEYYDREAPLVMSHLDIKQSVDSYKQKYFPDFKLIGRVKVIYKDIPENEVKGYGAYIGSNLIIMQKLFEPTIGKYVYEIIFLSGNIKDKNLYWYRNSSESEPLNKTLEALEITNLNDYMNIITHNLLNPNRKVAQKISSNYELEKKKQQPNEENTKQNTIKLSGQTVDSRLERLVNTASKSEQDKAKQKDSANEDNSYLLTDLTEEELYELQKALITFRVNAVVGYWEDAISGEIIEIRVIPSKKDKKNITYGAYSILDQDLDNIVRYKKESSPTVAVVEKTALSTEDGSTTLDSISAKTDSKLSNEQIIDINNLSNQDAILFGEEPLSLKDFTTLSINKSLAWVSQDLKMQFSSLGGSGFFIDEEKMLEDAKIFFHPAKGLIVVSLPNKEFKYYKPIIPDMYPVLEEALYNKINIKDTDVDQSKIARYSEELKSTAGSTNYLLWPGVTIGLFIAFFLIMV